MIRLVYLLMWVNVLAMVTHIIDFFLYCVYKPMMYFSRIGWINIAYIFAILGNFFQITLKCIEQKLNNVIEECNEDR